MVSTFVHSATVLLNKIIRGTNSYLTFKNQMMSRTNKPSNSDTKADILQEKKRPPFPKLLGQDINLVLLSAHNKTAYPFPSPVVRG
jgi:hypothetical protein